MTPWLLALTLQAGLWGRGVTEAAPARELEPLLREGDAHHDAGEYDSAREAYERGLALAPEAGEARERLAHLLNDVGERAVAESESAGAKADEERERALANEATRSFERARDLARELQDVWPDRPEGHYWYAASLANLTPRAPGPDKVRSAREIDAATRRAIALDPCFAPAWAALGVATREVARIGWFVRGVARAALGGLPPASLEEAEGTLRAAVALDPTDPFATYQLALTLEARDRPGDALVAFERALALPDREERDRRNRADAEARLRRLRPVTTLPGRTSR